MWQSYKHVNVKRFTGLNFRRFKPNEEKLLWCLTFKVFKQNQYLKLAYTHKKHFWYCSKPQKPTKSLAQQIFTHLQYYLIWLCGALIPMLLGSLTVYNDIQYNIPFSVVTVACTLCLHTASIGLQLSSHNNFSSCYFHQRFELGK